MEQKTAEQNHQGICKDLKLVIFLVSFFLMCIGLNFLNAAENIAGFWKFAGAVLVVLFIATIPGESKKTPNDSQVPIVNS